MYVYRLYGIYFRVELHSSQDSTRFAGFLAGLGAKSSGKQSKSRIQSVYKEYDFEVEFDTR